MRQVLRRAQPRPRDPRLGEVELVWSDSTCLSAPHDKKGRSFPEHQRVAQDAPKG